MCWERWYGHLVCRRAYIDHRQWTKRHFAIEVDSTSLNWETLYRREEPHLLHPPFLFLPMSLRSILLHSYWTM